MTWSARLARRLPEALVARLTGLLYQRVEPELGHLDDVCGRGGVMVDVGAWYGPWSQRLARRADRMVAIEPTARYRALRRVLPPGSLVIQAAAADRTGVGALWAAGRSDGAEGTASLRRRDIHGRALSVPLVRIDDLALCGVTFMKIDVEGSELPVLLGAAQTIRRDRPRLLVEVEARFQPLGDVVGLLAGWGYSGWVLVRGRWAELARVDLAGRQRAALRVADRGLLRRVLWPYPRYLNLVLFVPDAARRPGRELAPHSRRGRPAAAG